MYATHQPIIEAYARKNAEQMYNTLEFVVASIHRPFSTVPYVLRTAHGLSGRQYHDLSVMAQFKDGIYKTIMARIGDEQALLTYLASLPSLNTVKAGFMVQLVAGKVGCLDSWNAEKLGINTRRFSIDKKRDKNHTIARKITEYIAACENIGGGSSTLWNTWCAWLGSAYYTVDKRYRRLYPWRTAEEVSLFHVTACCR